MSHSNQYYATNAADSA